jgi:hypothetical protein
MSEEEFDKLFGFEAHLPLHGFGFYRQRLFRELNTGRAGDTGGISFAHWATGW